MKTLIEGILTFHETFPIFQENPDIVLGGIVGIVFLFAIAGTTTKQS